jgi:electron transport complex protein RnfD
MFQTLLMLLLGAGVSVVIELFYSLSEGTSQEFSTYRRWVDPVNSGLLIALLLPTTTPIYVLVLAVFIGVYVAKLAFGGYGYYIFHPALVGVLFVQVSFPGVYNELSTPLMQLKAVFTEAATLNFNLTDLLIGNYQAIAIGSTSILLLAVALVYLLITRVIDYRISGMFLLVMVVLSLMIGFISFGANALAYTAINLMTGLTMFGAVFLVPESVSSPTSREAKLIYATVVALMTMLVRTVGGAFEGIVFAVLLGNLITPYLNRTVTRSNQSTLIKTGIALAVVTLIAGLVLGFLVQNQLADTYEPVAQWIGGWFA